MDTNQREENGLHVTPVGLAYFAHSVWITKPKQNSQKGGEYSLS